MTEISAKDWMDPDGVIVASGELLAQQVLPALCRGENVRIKMDAMEGLSSSYFNIVLNMIREELSPEALSNIRFDGLSAIYRSVLDRSLAAALKVPVRNRT